MTKFRVNKYEAARRQIDVAIRMLFSKEDPVAILTLAVAGLRILRDIADKRGDAEFHERLKKIIIPGKEKEFWQTINIPANFLKHADRDPDAILNNVEDNASDWILFMACLYYRDLGHQLTPEMSALTTWHIALYPDIIISDDKVRNDVLNSVQFLHKMPRHDQLEIGRQLMINSRSKYNRF